MRRDVRHRSRRNVFLAFRYYLIDLVKLGLFREMLDLERDCSKLLGSALQINVGHFKVISKLNFIEITDCVNTQNKQVGSIDHLKQTFVII